MKITVFSKRDIVTHPLAVSLLENWSKEGHVEYFTIHSELITEKYLIHLLTNKKYLKHNKIKRYLMTIIFYFKMLFKILLFDNLLVLYGRFLGCRVN